MFDHTSVVYVLVLLVRYCIIYLTIIVSKLQKCDHRIS